MERQTKRLQCVCPGIVDYIGSSTIIEPSLDAALGNCRIERALDRIDRVTAVRRVGVQPGKFARRRRRATTRTTIAR